LFTYFEEWFDLHRDSKLTGVFEDVGPWGARFDNQLKVPGNYSFRAVGRYGHDCRGTREVTWSAHIAVGIDSTATTVTTRHTGRSPDGRLRVRVTITPKDRYGNLLGPGSSDEFVVTGIPGNEVVGPVTDNRDGTYSVDVFYDPGSGHGPGVSVTQPGRPSSCIEVRPSGPGPTIRGRGMVKWLWLIILILLVIILILLSR
jgi:hypothetical protein